MRISDWSSDVCSSDLEARVLEARVAHLQRMAQRQAADFAGQQRQEGVHVLGVELLGLHELPVHRPQALAQLGEALAGEALDGFAGGGELRSEEHTSELQSLMRISYAVFCLNKKKNLNQ